MVRVCADGRCVEEPAPSGTLAEADTVGDCRTVVCDGSGERAVLHDDGDAFDDDEQCTEDTCVSGTPVNTPAPAGASCTEDGGRRCDGNGNCVACVEGSDCASGVCEGFVCVPATCFDRTKNELESDVDCGGPECIDCPVGAACVVPSDCAGGHCAGSPPTCQPPTCTDGVHDGDETAVDCGGGCSTGCGPGEGCSNDDDCTGGLCTSNLCQPTCTDAVSNLLETGVDCGGPACPPCPAGQACASASDCESAVCAGAPPSCQPATCGDTVHNGSESDVDCGGSCPGCGPDAACATDSDCAGGDCDSATCQPSCTDGVQNGSETDVDCGGGCPQGCALGDACAACGDCSDGLSCGATNECAAPVCAAGKAECDGNACTIACETSLGFDEQHCGACGASCAVWSGCAFGACGGLWSIGVDNPLTQTAAGMVRDAAGNVIVAGNFVGTIDVGGTLLSASLYDFDAFVAKLDPAGTVLWVKHLFGQFDQLVQDVAVDAAGNVIVAGDFTDSLAVDATSVVCFDYLDVFVAKLDPTGAVVWVQGYGGFDYQHATAVAVDASGAIVVGGDFWGSADFGAGQLVTDYTDAFAFKVAPAGTPTLWSKQFGDLYGEETITDVAAYPNGDLAVTGYFNSAIDFGAGPVPSAGDFDGFIAKLDGDGDPLWSKTAGDPLYDVVASVDVDALGRSVISGHFNGTADFGSGTWTNVDWPDGFVAVFDDGGAPLWGTAIAASGATGMVLGHEAVLDVSGRVAWAATFQGGSTPWGASKGGNDILTLLFDASGNVLSGSTFGSSGYEVVRAIDIDAQGFLFLAGDYGGALQLGSPTLGHTGQEDLFVARVAP